MREEKVLSLFSLSFLVLRCGLWDLSYRTTDGTRVSAVKALPYVCGYCYTQFTDVQQEINGLLDIDRNFKIDPEIIKEINQRRVKLLQK